jgi:murein L,D-transpeptidase YcbB/YkuD
VSWIDRIDANLERWRWLPRQTPDTYIRVNIAAYTLRVIDKGDTVLAMNVIVGKPYRRTPVFTETVKYIVFNPYWNVPFKIATEDKLPLLKADASAEAKKGFEAKPQGSDVFVPVDTIDWSGVTKRNFNYLLRQRPGENNALGQMKFMLPNPNAVYLHDTPSRELFGKQERPFSSGCVRLERPRDLASWLLSREGNQQAGRLGALLASGETTTVYLKEPVPVYLVYFTAFVTDDGDVAMRRDIYGRDKVLVDALRGSES